MSPSIATTSTASKPVLRSGLQPLFEPVFRASGHHVQQPCRARSFTDVGVEADDDDIATSTMATTPSAPVISGVGATFQKGIVPGDVLAGAAQIAVIESAESREISHRECGLGDVEVFRTDGEGRSIGGRLRGLSGQRLAVSDNP